ncbi:Bacterial low temperature requirement A protein (LtrA) [Rhizoctonia solani]|uniref:Bacterial low temperature requirement A protein (LtrA) n=1 Tax=Rhizoctonia solani TaxID=456999 RepID=A0A8H7H1D6_9AGAM|nr:Bacterial low temperature requirement A protein (LtrA) [Rhizoctonia solani]
MAHHFHHEKVGIYEFMMIRDVTDLWRCYAQHIHEQQPHRTIHQFGPGNVHFHGKSFDDHDSEHSHHYSFKNLIRPPVVRQWIHLGKIHREHTERVPSRLELFFDLVFVAIAHQLSEAVAENASAAGLAKFVLIFYPTWSLWSEFRNFVNASGTDDVLQRLAVLWLMALLVGYTANASAIQLGAHESTEASTGAVHVALGSILAEAGHEPNTAEAVSSHYARDPALVTATAFFLVAKFSRVAFLIWYAIALPMFRSSFLLQIAYQMLNFFVYLPLLVVRSPAAIITLASLGMGTDYLLRYFVGIPIVLNNKLTKKILSRFTHEDLEAHHKGIDPTATTNIEHFIERTAAFVVIVLGEVVLSVVYHATRADIGFKSIYGSAVSGLIIAFNFCWLYFDAECSHTFVHAMRRHWFTSITFTNLHFPLCASLILVSAATSRMTQHTEEVTSAIRWYFGGGLGVALISMALIGATHRGLDPTGTSRLGRFTQLGFRVAVGIVMILLPLSDLSPLNLLGTSAGLTSFLVVEETYGKLRRGEPLAKPSAAEQDVIDAREHSVEDRPDATRIDSNLESGSVESGIKEVKTE